MESINNFPLISVIIPTYGGGQYISRSINSILAQSYPNIEIVVVDDNGLGAPNQIKTLDNLSPFISNNRIKYVCHEVNRNGSAARNTGVLNSSGMFVSFLDDDDEYYKDNLLFQYNAIKDLSDEYAITYCGREKFLNSQKVQETHAQMDGDILYEYLMRNIEIGSPGFLISRKVFDQLNGYDESFSRHQDWEFLTRVLSIYKAKSVNIIGYRVNIYQRNSPKNPYLAQEYREYFINKMKPYYSRLSQRQINNILRYNRTDIAIQFLKHKRFLKFIILFIQAKPRSKEFQILFKRIFNVLINGGQINASRNES